MILAKILGENDGPVARDTIFSVLQKDINSFDIETEISAVDLRGYRLSLTADSKKNVLLLNRLMAAGLSGAADADKIISQNQEALRTLPNFYSVQVSGPCPQACPVCPYPEFGRKDGLSITDRRDFMDPGQFETLLDKIIDFSGEAVVDISLWGETALHPRKDKLIQAVLDRPALSLVVETSGIGWRRDELEALAVSAKQAQPRLNRMAPLSWIVSLDSGSPERYKEVRGNGLSEARQAAETLFSLFPEDAYVQAVRIKGYEDDLEQFYRQWKERGVHIIVQKYDDFCGKKEKLQASDLSPLKRHPCWHIMRDISILMDGSVPMCREVLDREILGNVFRDSLESIWEKGMGIYKTHIEKNYSDPCAVCDEYYTYNF